MARILVFEGKGPRPLRLADGRVVSLCTCGLSKTFPFCSGAHIHVSGEEEGAVYVYKGHERGRIDAVIVEGRPLDPDGLPRIRVVEEET